MSSGISSGSAVDDESRFHAVADATLTGLLESIDDALGDDLDVDLQGGVLTIELESGGQYVINKHAPNRQLWLSPPLSGAAHFAHDPERGWTATRGDATLHALLAKELAEATGKPVVLR